MTEQTRAAEPITDRDMKDQIARALSGEPDDTFDARVEAIFTELHTTYGLIDLDTLMPGTFWANVERVDARLSQPTPEPTRTMLELVDAYADAAASKVAAGEYAGANEERAAQQAADEARAEIVRRLELIDRFGGTEASDIKAILATGDTVKWIYDK